MTTKEQLIAAGMNPNFVPPHKRADFDPVKYQGYQIAPAVMKDADGNDIPGNPFYDEEMAFWERQPLSPYCNSTLADCSPATGSGTTNGTTTAGTTKIPTMVWYALGAVALYYVGKKKKWF